MKNTFQIYVLIPAYNEEKSIASVIRAIPPEWVTEIVVINNNSDDRTAEIAESCGATVHKEPEKGYGYACLTGINYLREKIPKSVIAKTIVVFLDGDYSDYPQELPEVVQPIIEQNKDFVIGSRALGDQTKDAMFAHQKFGNWLASRLIRLFYGVKFTDLGPFRAIRFDKLLDLNMQDKTYGWTVEMQVKAAKKGLNCVEVPVSYRKRIGVSKVSGTIKGSVLAGYKIIMTIFKLL